MVKITKKKKAPRDALKEAAAKHGVRIIEETGGKGSGEIIVRAPRT